MNYDVFGSLMPSELDDADGIENIDIRDIPPFETKQEAEKRQQGQRLKILTPQ